MAPAATGTMVPMTLLVTPPSLQFTSRDVTSEFNGQDGMNCEARLSVRRRWYRLKLASTRMDNPPLGVSISGRRPTTNGREFAVLPAFSEERKSILMPTRCLQVMSPSKEEVALYG